MLNYDEESIIENGNDLENKIIELGIPKDAEWIIYMLKNKLSERPYEEFSDEEKLLFTYDDFFEELNYNWGNIYYTLFGYKKANFACEYFEISDEKIPKEIMPKGLKDLFEVDEDGNPTGFFNWDYATSILEKISGCNIYQLVDYIDEYVFSQRVRTALEVFDIMPLHMKSVYSNLNKPDELAYTLVICQNADYNCPMQVRDNEDIMYGMFKEVSSDDSEGFESCYDLLSDRLKNDKKFLERVFELESDKNYECLSDKINPEFLKDDDEFCKKFIKFSGIFSLIEHWDCTSHLLDEILPTIEDYDLKNALELYKDKKLEEISPELCVKLNVEAGRRFGDEITEDGSASEEIQKVINDTLAVMRSAVGKTIGNTLEVEEELNQICEEQEVLQNVESNIPDLKNSGDEIDTL